ncbi:MAG: hypothetical protein IIB77_13345 [Proteobacteria bacterium]|nr:hypothetical protein [Pseudomonadota bacterium]
MSFRIIKKNSIFMVVNQNGAIFYSGRSKTEAIKTQRTMEHRVATRMLGPSPTTDLQPFEKPVQAEMEF